MARSVVTNSSVTRLLSGVSEGDVLLEGEKVAVGGVPVRAAPLPALVRMLVNSFDETGCVLQEAERLPYVVFLMHRWFTASTELSQQLISLHDRAACGTETCSHTSCAVAGFRLRVCHAIRYWIMNFPMQFDLENGLSESLKEFQATLTPPLAELVDLSQVPSYDRMRHVSVRNTNAQTPQVSRKVSLVLNNLEPAQLAEHITSLEHKIIRRISFQDYKTYAYSGSLRDTPRLEHSVALFNGLTQWIQCLVLSRTTPQQRADVIAKFINIAKKLLEMQNFNSLMGVVGSITHSVLARLSKTMACLPTCSKKLLAELTDLLSSTNNFHNYRKALAECTGFKIPILGIHLKDLISLHAAMADTVNDAMMNVRKMAQLSLIFHELEELQMSAPPVEPNMDLVNTLRLSLDLAYTDDEIYELSLAREPRNSSSPQWTPSVTSVVFAEWAGGPSPPPHPHTIEKHVTTMVEAVFNNYDTDRDGYISHEEFEAVATNFPFIASFCVLDADHDGMISHEEMKKYFVHANCHALKSRFNHEFHETTYFKPTFCAHCAGLLWGLIRQGYKCRDCSINAHKHCKDLVVMECRLRNIATGEPSSSHALSSRRKFRRKKKSSVSESESSASSAKCSTASSLSIGDTDAWGHSEPLLDGGGSLPPSPKTTGPRRKISDSLLVPSLNRAATRLKPQTSCPESCYGKVNPPLCHQATIQPCVKRGAWTTAAGAEHPPTGDVSGAPHISQALLRKQIAIREEPDHGRPASTSTNSLQKTRHDTAAAAVLPATTLHTRKPSGMALCPHTSCDCYTEHLNTTQQKLKEVEEAKQRLLKENRFLLEQLECAYRELNALREHVGEVRQHTVSFILGQMETLHIQKDTHL